jgi:hypothetical protein
MPCATAAAGGDSAIIATATVKGLLMAVMAHASTIAQRYERFAMQEACGSSPIWEQLALGVAGSPQLLAFLTSIPCERRQPNLFLAAVRHVAGVPRDCRHMEAIVRVHAPWIRRVMLSRTTQTNEPARCSVLLALLARLDQPLALIEVGAAAGLCLLPDRYGYDYGQHRIEPPSPDAPCFRCTPSATTPLPRTLPTVGWRCGLDLHPLDINCPSAMAWLETLVWPGQEFRAKALRAAIEVARADPPPIRQGDLLTDLPAIAALAPKGMQLVIYHSAVLGYVGTQRARDAFAETVKQIGAVWISNEAPSVFPQFAGAAPPPPGPGHFLLAINGTPVAWSRAHGQSIEWFAS